MTLAITDLDQFRRGGGSPGPEWPPNIRRFYSPIDDVHGALKAILGSAQHSIVLALYGYDDEELAGMVAHAIDDPHMYVQVTLDKSQAGGVHERELLARWKHEYDGNSVAVGTSEKSAIMHRKMLIVDGVWCVSGSTNWSTSGETAQDNELTVIQSAAIAAMDRAILDVEHDHALMQMQKRKAKEGQ